MKVALVHDWLTGMRGGEYVLEAIAEIFPKAHLFTLLYVPGKISPLLTTLPRTTSWLQKVPNAEHRYRHFLPLMPQMIEKFDLSGYDLIVSSSHCVAKGVQKPLDSVHVSYVHAPMRYMWDRFDDYFGPGRASPWVRWAAKSVRPRLQAWDRRVSQKDRVDALIANSRFISDRIRDAYGRTDASVVHPFVEYERFASLERKPGRHYLMIGAFAPYKRIDLAIEAFNQMGLPLIIAGSGQDERRLKKIARPNIEFLGSLSNRTIADLYSKCRALIFPGVEDFGITPLEAMASGAPVIAAREGGASETVTDQTGILFWPQTVEALVEAVSRVEHGDVKFDPEACKNRAREFSRERFQKELVTEIVLAWKRAGKPVETLNALLGNVPGRSAYPGNEAAPSKV